MLTGCVGRNVEAGDGVDDAEDKVRNGEPPDVDHRLAEGGLDDAVAHAHDEQQEEGEGVPGGVEHGDDDQEDLGPDVGPVVVHVFWAGLANVPW